MSKKQVFIDFIEDLTKDVDMPEDAKIYWEALKGKDEEKPLFTENGKMILEFLQNHQDVPLWKSRDIADGLFVGSKAVSGSIRKLVTDGYVEKVGKDPVIYSITEKGKNINLTEENN